MHRLAPKMHHADSLNNYKIYKHPDSLYLNTSEALVETGLLFDVRNKAINGLCVEDSPDRVIPSEL